MLDRRCLGRRPSLATARGWLLGGGCLGASPAPGSVRRARRRWPRREPCATGGTARQRGQQRQHGRGDQRSDRAQAEMRAAGDVGHGRGDAQPAVRHRDRQRFGAVGMSQCRRARAGEAALAQCQVGVVGHATRCRGRR